MAGRLGPAVLAQVGAEEIVDVTTRIGDGDGKLVEQRVDGVTLADAQDGLGMIMMSQGNSVPVFKYASIALK